MNVHYDLLGLLSQPKISCIVYESVMYSCKNHSSQKKRVCSIVDNTYKIARDWRPEKTTDGISSSLFPSNILKRFEASLKILYNTLVNVNIFSNAHYVVDGIWDTWKVDGELVPKFKPSVWQETVTQQ